MSEWKECRLGSTGKVITGKTPSKDNPEDWGDSTLFITPSDYGNYNKYAYSSIRKLSQIGTSRQTARLLPAGSILVTCIGSDMGKTVINSRPCVPNQQINAIIPNTKIVDSNFLYYETMYLYDVLHSMGSDGTAVPILNKTDFENIDLLLPPLPEQRAIAAVLSSLDNKIDLLHRQNKTLEAMAETLFRQWFVEEAEEGWREGKLGDIITVVSGTTPKTEKPEFWNGEYHWTSPRDITNLSGLFLFDTERKITKQGLEQIGSGLLPIGSLLMSSRAPVGALAFSEIPVAINQGYAGIICDKGFSREFIYLWLKSNMDFVQSHANGSTFQEISKSTFRELDLNIPDSQTHQKFHELISPIFSKMKTNSIQIRTLESLRDTLLPKLMSGEVKVKYE